MAISRRGFFSVAAAGAVAAAGVANAKSVKALGKDFKWTEKVEVLICGGGLAGLSAAVQAVESGVKNVLVLEKGTFLGGHALISGGGFVASGTSIQKKAGIEDSPENDWNDAVKRGLALNQFLKTDTAVARRIFEEQGPAVEWLISHGVKFEEKPGYGYGNANRLHYFAPTGTKGNGEAIKSLTEAAKKLGVKFMLNTRLVELVTADNALGSPVLGAVAEDKDGKKLYIEATCGVIIASGGFGKNPEMVKRYHPYLEGIPCYSSPLATGDGIKAALDLGAAINVTHSDLGGTFACIAKENPKVRINGFAPSNLPLVIVNPKGQRIIDESRGGRYISSEMVTSKNPLTFWIFDKKHIDEAQNKWFKALFKAGNIVHEYATLDDLAKGEGIDLEGLKKTVAAYNEDAKAGKDKVFGKVKLLEQLEAPYFVIAAQPTILYTYTGLWINPEAQVLDTRDQPIPGLYAAGDISGRWDAIVGLGQGGMSGLGLAVVTGRIAARNAATKCAKKA